jgi:hypothetical protein
MGPVGGVKRLLDKGSMWVYGRVGCELCGPRPRGEAACGEGGRPHHFPYAPWIAAPFEGHLETVRLLIPISHPSARTTTNHRDVTARRGQAFLRWIAEISPPLCAGKRAGLFGGSAAETRLS